MRFYETDEGEILLDGEDIRMYAPVSLRRLVGIVLQDTVLFSDTVRNNIAYARPEATMARYGGLAKLAHADDFIAHLPQQYATVLQSAGAELLGWSAPASRHRARLPRFAAHPDTRRGDLERRHAHRDAHPRTPWRASCTTAPA